MGAVPPHSSTTSRSARPERSPVVDPAPFDQVVDEYWPVVLGLENDIDEIEDQVFQGDPAVSRRIYELFREVIEFQRATRPLVAMLGSLREGFEEKPDRL